MLGLRFFACEECDTVYADIEEPRHCGTCDGAHIAEISSGMGATTYFAPSQTDRC